MAPPSKATDLCRVRVVIRKPKKLRQLNQQPIQSGIRGALSSERTNITKAIRGLARTNRSTTDSCQPRPGLPSFSNALPIQENNKTTKAHEESDDCMDEFSGEDVLLATIECDTLLAFRSLQRGCPGSVQSYLEVPIPYCGNKHIRGILECQLHQFFREQRGGGSSITVSQEIQQLCQSNTLRVLSNGRIDHTTSICVYLWRHDYERAAMATIQQTHNNQNRMDTKYDDKICIVEWFLQQLCTWTDSFIDEHIIRCAWDNRCSSSCNSNKNHKHRTSLCSASDVLRLLQECQLLHAATIDHNKYQLWLPTWGGDVLPTLLKAKTTILTFLLQSKPKLERSLTSIVQRLRHCIVPVHTILVPWMVEQGWVQLVERPSGLFVKFLEK